ncbi:MAG: cadherin-like beta sandwich domain-containing protein [Clostridia bacterium]|nr:cadherin-like beta sandwich domain-containing protein [Clostridia bacterium]
MKKIVIYLSSIILCITMIFSTGLYSMAVSGKATIICSPTINVGNSINVTVSAKKSDSGKLLAFGGIIRYDSQYLEFDKSAISDDVTVKEYVVDSKTKELKLMIEGDSGELKITVKFKTLKVGTAKVLVKDCEAVDSSYNDILLDGDSKNISIIAPTKSDDNTLKSLKVGAGTLTPAFSRYVTEYKVTVPYSVDYFNIQPTTNHKGASYKFSDGPGPRIKVGTTVRVVTVTAENGSVRKYNIAVTRLPQDTTSSTSSADTSSTTSTVEPEENKLETSVDGNKMTVAEIIPDDVTAPGFEKGEYTFNSVHVPAFLDKEKEVVLLYLLNEENKGELYMYNSATGIFSLPCIINNANHYTILPVTALMRDQILIDTESVFNLSTITIGEQEVEAYIYKDDALSDFAVVCAMNSEGEKAFYRYDRKENTLQRYVAEYRAEDTDAPAVGALNTDAIVVLVCAGVCLAAIIAIIIIWAARRRYYDDDFDDDFDDAEPLFIKETELDTTDRGETLVENENQPDIKENEAETEIEEE